MGVNSTNGVEVREAWPLRREEIKVPPSDRPWLWLMLSIALFLLGCKTPALLLHWKSSNGHQWFWIGYRSLQGWELLYMGMLFGWTKLNFAAYANLALWFGWLMLGLGKVWWGKIAATLGLLLSLQTFQMLVQPFYENEAATSKGYLSLPEVGYYLWIGSMGVLWYASNRGLQSAMGTLAD